MLALTADNKGLLPVNRAGFETGEGAISGRNMRALLQTGSGQTFRLTSLIQLMVISAMK